MTRDKDQQREYFRKWYHNRMWPKCEVCGFIARCLRDAFGCLECYARTQPRREWTEDEKDLIELYAGKDDHSRLQYRIYQDTGFPRSRHAIRKKIRDMGINSLTHQDGFTIPQLAEITGRAHNVIHNYVKRNGMDCGNGARVLVSTEDGYKVIARYEKRDTPSYSTTEAIALIGITPTAIKEAIKIGLPAWKEGRSYRVCKATVDRAVDYLRKTGAVRVPWRSLLSV